MKLINGKEFAKDLRVGLKDSVEKLIKSGKRVPHLVVVLIGENPASQTYVRFKERACNQVGIKSSLIKLGEAISENDLLLEIENLNNDDKVDGILVQLPLPKHINEDKVIDQISVKKDVDGFHKENIADLSLNKECTHPCTPKGIIKLLENENVDFDGANAVIVGRSNIVGKPIAQMLLNKNCTVVICHSRTKDLKSHLLNADIVIAAVGIPNFLKASMLSKKSVVIDVGINRLEDGSLVGDVDFSKSSKKVKAITPVPGGVGPMTIACLLENTIELYNKNYK